MKKARPSDLEMQILGVLWGRGPSTAREVLEAMPDGKERAYTSVLSVMQVMEKKGLLKHTSRGVAHVYSPAVNKNKIIRPFVRKVVSEVFAGKPSALMQELLAEGSVSQEELRRIRKLLDEADNSKGSA
jgi:BlaI family penicillinase repressor